ncbi:MAG: hypothetical protein GXY07_11200 [Candidatus Hydrogenedentes bacterium]|nr:hypothetical protein [Candidatus Hydrogenedentota bacterium]
MKRAKTATKQLFIEELERPEYAFGITTLAIGEEACCGDGHITTLALGEEAK